MTHLLPLLRLRLLPVIMLVWLTTPYQAGARDTLSHKRLKPLIIGSTAAYAGSLIALNRLWYADFEKQDFHFFNDNKEWQQIDKAGHFYAAFHLSKAAYRGLRWAGVAEKKSLIWGGIVSAIALTPIEVFDGFSAGYGASAGDLVANTLGGTFFMAQQWLWGEIRVHPKFSFRRTDYARLRPQVLGSTLSEEIIKDYNGQTYWWSVDISGFIPSFPKWLNLAVGYGADGMVFAREGQNAENGYTAVRQFYLTIDPDFSRYRSQSKLVNTFLYVLTMIKLPTPALRYSQGQFGFGIF